MLIANGRGVDLWNDPWIPGIVLCRSGLAFNADGFGTISSLLPLLSEQDWDLERIAFFLGRGIAHIVASCCIRIHPHLSSDCWAWGVKMLARPKVLDFYLGLHRSDPSLARLARVWKIRCPEMVKLMMWKVLLGKLPTRGFLFSFGISDGMCRRCSVFEDLDHLGCPFAKSVWCKVLDKVNAGFYINSLLCLRDLILSASCNSEWGLKVSIAAITMWQVWCARNRLTFDGKALSPTSVCLSSLAMLELHAFPAMTAVGSKIRLVRASLTSGWSPPSYGVLKLNFMGAWHPFTGSGIGFVLRDANSNAILAGGQRTVAASHLFASIYAAAWALSELSTRFEDLLASMDIIIESSSATSIDWLAGKGGVSVPVLPIAKCILGRFRKVEMMVCSSSANATAWRLAEVGCHLSCPTVWDISCIPTGDLAKRGRSAMSTPKPLRTG